MKLTEEETKKHIQAETCWICEKKFFKYFDRVRTDLIKSKLPNKKDMLDMLDINESKFRKAW
jgi:hypothetical protein